jgi:flagellin
MSVVINTNIAATIAANNLADANQLLQRSLNRLSSGSKVVNASDDAGGLAVAMKLSAASNRSGEVSNNISNTNSLLQTQDGALSTAGDILDRISELKTLNADPTKNTSDQANYQDEFAQLQDELVAIGGAQFNGINLFGTSSLSVATAEDGSGIVTVPAANLLQSGPGFATMTSDFSDLSQFTTLEQNGGTVSASGNVATLNGGSSNAVAGLLTTANFTTPFDLDFDVRLSGDTSGLVGLAFGNGGNLVSLDSGVISDTAWHSVHVVVDGSGSVHSYLDGSATPFNQSSVPTAAAYVGVGAVGDETGVELRNFSVTSTSTGITGGDLATVAAAGSLGSLSLASITDAIQNVATERAKNGASQSELSFASQLLTINQTNLESATSRITDVDVAAESSVLARANILVQASTAMLSQANQAPQMVLKLISG